VSKIVRQLSLVWSDQRKFVRGRVFRYRWASSMSTYAWIGGERASTLTLPSIRTLSYRSENVMRVFAKRQAGAQRWLIDMWIVSSDHDAMMYR